MEQKIASKLYDVPVDVAQQAVSHFRNLFELPSANTVIPKMNDLFVFYAEVNDGDGVSSRASSIERITRY
jgi:hypothetical protein